MEWISVAQDRDKWRFSAYTVVNHRVTKTAASFFTDRI